MDGHEGTKIVTFNLQETVNAAYCACEGLKQLCNKDRCNCWLIHNILVSNPHMLFNQEARSICRELIVGMGTGSKRGKLETG